MNIQGSKRSKFVQKSKFATMDEVAVHFVKFLFEEKPESRDLSLLFELWKSIWSLKASDYSDMTLFDERFDEWIPQIFSVEGLHLVLVS